MNYLYEPSKIGLTYGSIISFMFEKEDNKQAEILPEFVEPLNMSNNEEKSVNLRKEEFSDILISREFLYSQGVFNEVCFFHNFKDKNALKYNYYNSLFLVLPKSEYESMTKFRALKRRLKKEILINDKDIDKTPIIYCYNKFKQEIYTNQEYSIKILNSNEKYVNFNDSVQFMHIKSGKFLEFKKNNESLKIHIQLTDTLSENTIFRFIPAFNYQGENSARVMINLILKIGCGAKQTSTENEKFLSKREKSNKSLMSASLRNNNNYLNSNKPKTKALRLGKDLLFKAIKKVGDIKYKALVKVKDTRNSLRKVVNDEKTNEKIKSNFKDYINSSDISFVDFGKKILHDDDNTIIAGNRTSNHWRILSFSTNFIEDNKYINSLDFFCIQNYEKNLYIQAIDHLNANYLKMKKYRNSFNTGKNITNEPDSSLEELDNQKKESINRIRLKMYNINNKYTKNTRTSGTTNETHGNTIKLNYFYEQDFNLESNYDLIVNYYEENDYIEPLSLFKFEVVYNTGEYSFYENNPKYTIDILKDNSFVRLINVFTNKVLMAELNITPIGNIPKLKLVNNLEVEKKDYFKTVFIIEKIQDYEELLNDDDNQENNDFKNNKQSKENKDKKREKSIYINKNEYIKIKSKKFNLYLGIRLNNTKHKSSLVLTNSISDLTKFKLNFLDEIDKYELHFFEQLIWSFDNIINYFKNEKNAPDNSITYESYQNYEKIQHILFELEFRINNFPEHNKVNISQKNKFDFMKAIEHFNIVSKLVDIFLANWFNDSQNLNYYEMEEKLKKYFEGYKRDEDVNLSKYKKLIAKKIFKILIIIYDLNKSYLNIIVDKLLYFFMFVGRDDKCTKFLIHILKNNGTLLISLCPVYIKDIKKANIFGYNQRIQYNQNSINNQYYINNQLNYNNINNINNQNINNNIINGNKEGKNEKYIYLKHCLKRIIDTYNNLNIVQLKINFSSVLLLFKLFNCLIIYNNKPFSQFYDEYFNDLELLKTQNWETMPNYEKNPILVEFTLKNQEVFVKKRKFFNKTTSFIQNLINEKEAYDGLTNSSINDEEFEFKLSELIYINSKKDVINHYSAIIFSKLVSLNLIFFSHLSLCNKELKSHLQKIFNFDNIINTYLYDKNINETDLRRTISFRNKPNILNDLKCSLAQLLNYLYFHISFPFLGKMDLFYCLEPNFNNNNITNLHSSIIHNPKPKSINENILNNICNYISKLLIESTKEEMFPNMEPLFLVQILECVKYILRNLYNYRNNPEKINKSIDLVSLILLLLEKYIGFSFTKELYTTRKNAIYILNIFKKDNLQTNDDLYLISDSSKLVFEKYKKKLLKVIKSKENISNKNLFKQLFLIFISQKEEKKLFLDFENIENSKYRQRTLEKLKQYELSQILMELSISRNNEHKTIIDDILFLISDIFLEFFKYIENLEINKIFNKIDILNRNKIKKAEGQPENEFYDKLINSIVQKEDDAYIYLRQVMEQYKSHKIGNKNENDINDFQNEERYEDTISFFFFKFLHIIDNNELKIKILEILYKANSQKKIFFENITNVVLFDTNNEYNKLIDLKDLFIKIFNTMHSINLIKRLDNNSFALFEELNIQFENLINLLLDEKRWRRENNIFNVYGKINYNEHFNEDVLEIKRKKSIFNSDISNIENISNMNKYFLSEFSKEKVSITQQTLYNLGFINLINQVFEYISWVVNIKDDFSEELLSLERILISIYKLLVVFIFDNKKHQFIIKEKLNLYLCPLKLTNKSGEILSFIGYFLLNVVYFFESQDDFNQIKNLDHVISSLNILQYLEWEKNKKIIPFYVQSFKIIISFCNYDYFVLLYPVLEVINHILVKEIYKNTDTNDDLLSLIKILELITNEQKKKCCENKNTSILSLNEIINVFLNMINLITQDTVWKYMKLSQIFIIVTNLLYNHSDLYKNDFQINKRYTKNLTETLIRFNEKVKLQDDLVYCNKNKNNINLRYFNEFIGISIPKLYILLSSLHINKDDSFSSIINISNNLYEIILSKLENDQKEKIFLTKKNQTEVDDILKKLGIEIFLLSVVNNNIMNSSFKLSMPKIIKSLITKKNLLNKLLINDEFNPESFSYIWNNMKKKIYYNKSLINFHNYAKNEINKERMDYVQYLNNFFEKIDSDDIIKNNNNYEIDPDNNIKIDNNYDNYSDYNIQNDNNYEFYSENNIQYDNIKKNSVFFF